MPIVKPLEIEKNVDKGKTKNTRNKEYFEYLVKSKIHLVEDATYMIEHEHHM